MIHLMLCLFFLWCTLLQTGAMGDVDTGTLDSDGVAVSVLMMISVVGVLIVAALLFVFEVAAKTAKELAEKRLRDHWAGATVDPPTTKWPASKSYSCFLSHYKMEAASDARLLHDMLSKMLQYPVFLDSAKLTDLRSLITNGVADCDVMLVLGTKDYITRPWCLLEIVHARRLKTPTIVLDIKNGNFNVDDSLHYIKNIEAVMGADNPDGLALLREHLGDDLSELKTACTEALNTFKEGKNQLTWNPNASDSELIACLKDIIDTMATATGSTLSWKGEIDIDKTKKKKKKGQTEQSAIHLICSCDEALNDARVMQTELAMKLGRLVTTDAPEGDEDLTAKGAEAVAVLLTKHVLHEPAALIEIYQAAQQGKTMVPICLYAA